MENSQLVSLITDKIGEKKELRNLDKNIIREKVLEYVKENKERCYALCVPETAAGAGMQIKGVYARCSDSKSCVCKYQKGGSCESPVKEENR